MFCFLYKRLCSLGSPVFLPEEAVTRSWNMFKISASCFVNVLFEVCFPSVKIMSLKERKLISFNINDNDCFFFWLTTSGTECDHVTNHCTPKAKGGVCRSRGQCGCQYGFAGDGKSNGLGCICESLLCIYFFKFAFISLILWVTDLKSKETCILNFLLLTHAMTSNETFLLLQLC